MGARDRQTGLRHSACWTVDRQRCRWTCIRGWSKTLFSDRRP